jgi:hypothetical protein
MKSSCILVALFSLSFMAGCQKQGPIDLIDGGSESNPIEIITTPASSAGTIFGADDIDPAGLFPVSQQKTFGQLIVAGSEFDSATVHHEGSLARAIFFDHSEPVIVNSDTIAYRSLDAGIVALDDVPLLKLPKRLVDRTILLDTLLGVQYSLVDRDGIGGRGFQFSGGHAYRWRSSGSGSIPPISLGCTSPPALHVSSPAPGDVIPLSRDLEVHWNGGGSTVGIIISDYQSDRRTRPLIQLRLRVNRGSVVIPSSLLQILRDRTRALFTFTSQTASTARVTGFGDDILVQAITTHHLLLTLKR